MDFEYSDSSKNTAMQWLAVIVIIIVFLILVWIFSQFIQNNNENKSIINKNNKSSKSSKVEETVDAKQTMEYLRSNVELNPVEEKSSVENLDQFKANVQAAHDILNNYLNTLVQNTEAILQNTDYTFKSKHVKQYNKDVQETRDYLADIQTKLTELNNLPAGHKHTKKYVNYLTNKLRSTYNRLDQVQYDLLNFYDEVYLYSLKNNVSQEDYLVRVEPIVNTLKYELDTHQSLNATPNKEIICAFDHAVDEINKKRTKVPISRTQATEEYYVKLNSNFVHWWKKNVENL